MARSRSVFLYCMATTLHNPALSSLVPRCRLGMQIFLNPGTQTYRMRFTASNKNDERSLLRRTAAVLWTCREPPTVATSHISTVASNTPSSARLQISNSRSITPMTCRNFKDTTLSYALNSYI